MRIQRIRDDGKQSKLCSIQAATMSKIDSKDDLYILSSALQIILIVELVANDRKILKLQ